MHVVPVEWGAGAYADVLGICRGGGAAEQSAGERELSRPVADAPMPGGPISVSYGYDDGGHCVSEGVERKYEWDHAGRLRSFRNQATDATEPTQYVQYLYDASGQRVKKLNRKQLGSDWDVVVYIDGVLELRTQQRGATTKQGVVLHVLDGGKRLGMRRTGETFDAKPDNILVLSDHLGSGSVELDWSLGDFIDREEFRPYGETSFGSYAHKRYRFTGKERDEESGLNYHGARYYAPGLARWISPDPKGLVDGVNVYGYVRGNPVRLSDPTGTEAEPNAPAAKQIPQSITPQIHHIDRDASGELADSRPMSSARRDAWNAAERAGYDNKTINDLTGIINKERNDTKQDMFTQKYAYDMASVRATAATSHWKRGNWGYAAINATLGAIEGIGGFGFGNTNTQTAKRLGATAALLVVFGMAIGMAGGIGYQLGRYSSGKNIPPTPEPVDLSGTAIIYSNGRHVSIQVNGPTTLHTEQLTLGGGKQTTIGIVDSADQIGQSLNMSLPNSYNARLFQDSKVGMALGPYNAKTNSCVTHVGDVLRVGGIAEVPRTTLDIVRFLKKHQGK